MSRKHPLDKRSFLDSELASELYVDEVLDGSGRIQYLDSMVSMSALPDPGPIWVDRVIEEQYRRFINGS